MEFAPYFPRLFRSAIDKQWLGLKRFSLVRHVFDRNSTVRSSWSDIFGTLDHNDYQFLLTQVCKENQELISQLMGEHFNES